MATVNAGNAHDVFRLPDRDAPLVVRRVTQAVIDGCRCDVVFEFANDVLWFQVDENDDTIIARFVDAAAFAENVFESDKTWSDFAECRELIGKVFGWTWQAVNSQGYCDTFLISFEGVAPSAMLHGLASSIELFRIEHATKRPSANG